MYIHTGIGVLSTVYTYIYTLNTIKHQLGRGGADQVYSLAQKRNHVNRLDKKQTQTYFSYFSTSQKLNTVFLSGCFYLFIHYDESALLSHLSSFLVHRKLTRKFLRQEPHARLRISPWKFSASGPQGGRGVGTGYI